MGLIMTSQFPFVLLGSPSMGWIIEDEHGSYTAAWIFSGLVVLSSIFTFGYIPRLWRKIKIKSEAAANTVTFDV